MKHKHHIIPKHMGGSDEPSNIVELTVEEHADAHRLLWEQHGKKEDLLAWLSLSKQASEQEIQLIRSSIGGKNNRASGDDFVIEVVRFTSKPYPHINDGGNKWCMYVYVYPKHPLFKKMNLMVGDTLTCYDDRLLNMPLHGGCTYTKIHLTDDGKEITSIQMGADYSHYRDEGYSFMATKEDAYEVFFDAEQLYKWMQNYDGNDKENTDVM